MEYKDKLKDNRAAAPFLLPEKDPAYIKHRKPSPKPLPASLKRKSKPNKVLTNLKRFATLFTVNKLKRKGDKMATDNKQKTTNSNRSGAVKGVAWLVLAAQQAFAGYALLANFTNYLVIATAIVCLLIAGGIVVAHFFKAYK